MLKLRYLLDQLVRSLVNPSLLELILATSGQRRRQDGDQAKRDSEAIIGRGQKECRINVSDFGSRGEKVFHCLLLTDPHKWQRLDCQIRYGPVQRLLRSMHPRLK
jgi:hypothetical protein